MGGHRPPAAPARSSSSTTARLTLGRVAAAHGARVVTEPQRGYGGAYLTGLAAAQGEYVVMADADGTYPVEGLGPLPSGSRRVTIS